jgi:hypothetical protein
MAVNGLPSRFGHAWLKATWGNVVALVAMLASLSGCGSTQPSLDVGRGIAEKFLTDLRESRPEQAWQSTTAEFKSARGREAFVSDVQRLKFLFQPLDFVSVQEVIVQEQPRSEYLFRAKTGETVRIVIGQEDGQWKVDRWVF